MSGHTYFAKIENKIVTDVRVVSWDFLTENPERYGDSSLWIEVFPDNSGRGYCSRGWMYDSDLDEFVAPKITKIVTEEESVTPDGNN